MVLYSQQQGDANMPPVCSQFGVLYLSISVLLNALLTLMIVIRLALHGKIVRKATRSSVGISALFRAISVIFFESSILLAVSSWMVIGALLRAEKEHWPGIYNPRSSTVDVFFMILAETQVRVFP